jgi:hypothetical protein
MLPKRQLRSLLVSEFPQLQSKGPEWDFELRCGQTSRSLSWCLQAIDMLFEAAKFVLTTNAVSREQILPSRLGDPGPDN